MTDNEQWGVGANADTKAFDKVDGGELIFGEFPHSRQDNNIYLRRPNGDIIAFDGHRRLIDVNIKSSNYNKDSYWSGDEIRKRCIGTVTVDGVQLVEEFGREPIEMMRRLERLIQTYSEHESGWFNKRDRDNLIGRKIYYYNQKAVIKSLIEDQNAIIIETEPGFIPPMRDEDEDEPNYWDEEWAVGNHYEVKEDVLSPQIWWWRS